ncbi:hypothetical protein [Winogradskyella alexanderae]|uniref:Uncharacterized protein n=1 Tax=Winogradskyella alexanderae TaxID=2877123 RepID=A0ABS7XPL2_9FLAO|nr:hypothetical protein [Winogradskyella alexanderae]MCA0131953.1 hypothetical protein [Winogradskyella alexanderae]
MGFSFSKLKAAFGGESKPNKPVDTTEKIIAEVENTPFGLSESNVLFAGLNELGGYYFFQTVVVGNFKFKTFDGAKLIMKSNDFEIELDSDTVELESEPTQVSKRFITKIDFQIEESDINKPQSKRITQIILKTNKGDISFTKYVGQTEEEE